MPQTEETLIPYSLPCVGPRELEYVREAFASRRLSGDHSFTRRCADMLADHLDSATVLLTTSCTHALEMSALLLGIEPGDEVVMPSFTFVSTANAFVLRGAKPMFVDIRPDTLNLDETRLEEAITERTRAVVPVHYAGVACEMETIQSLASSVGAAVIEDNAHGLFGKYRGRPLGTIGQMSTLSFHETKNITCGEGGALVINDSAYGERAEIIREKGTDRSKFFRGEVDKYSWVEAGSSYLPSDILAAVLCAQLEHWQEIQQARQSIWYRYDAYFRPREDEFDLRTPVVPDECAPAYHLYHLILASAQERDEFIAHMRARGIHAVFHYVPLHTSVMGLGLGNTPGSLPVTEDLAARLVRLPFYNDLSEADQLRVIEAAAQFFERR